MSPASTHASCPRSLAGRRFDQSLLDELPAGVDPCAENGEFHTFARPVRCSVAPSPSPSASPSPATASCSAIWFLTRPACAGVHKPDAGYAPPQAVDAPLRRPLVRHDHHRQRRASSAPADPPGAERRASAQRPDPVDDPGHVSASQGDVPAGLRADRADHARVPGDLVAAAAGARLRHGPQAVALRDGRRHGLDAGRAARAGVRGQLRDGARLGGPGRARLGRVPSGSDAHGAPRRRRPAGLCARHFPDRRTRRIRDRAAARGDDRGAARADESRLGVGGGAGGDGADGVDRRALCRHAPLAGRRGQAAAR